VSFTAPTAASTALPTPGRSAAAAGEAIASKPSSSAAKNTARRRNNARGRPAVTNERGRHGRASQDRSTEGANRRRKARSTRQSVPDTRRAIPPMSADEPPGRNSGKHR
jgi:hypothetical protein